MTGYSTPKEVAVKIGVKYPAFMARLRKGQIKHERIGWNILIPDSEVSRLVKESKAKC